MTPTTPPAVSEAMRDAVARKLAELDGWTNPDALWTDNAGMIARGFQGDPIWWDYREEADALCAPAGPIASEIARLTGENAELLAQHVIENDRMHAAEAETARLRAALEEIATNAPKTQPHPWDEEVDTVCWNIAQIARAALSSQEQADV